MKTYFAKYLPVEGELNIGDLIPFDNCQPQKIYRMTEDKIWVDDGNGFPSEYNEYNRKEMKKAQLFLCSRDIQIGDKVDNIHSPTPGAICTEVYSNEYKKESETDWDGIISWVDPTFSDDPEDNKFAAYSQFKHWFKVIGPISSEAKWVKGGDEFDESEIKKYALLPPNQLTPWIEENERLGYTTVTKIKGPCGHFH